jgi:hypothetical protein
LTEDKQIGGVAEESDDLYENGLWSATVDKIESSGECDLHSISLSQRMECTHYTCVRGRWLISQERILTIKLLYW